MNSRTTPMDPGQKRLKEARAEIEAVLKRHDLAGFVTLAGPGWGEVFWNIWPSYSVLSGDLPEVRVRSKLADYGGDVVKQRADQETTAGMIRHLAVSMGGCGMQFLELSNLLDQAFGVEHTDMGFYPAPSKSNPGTH